MKGWLSVWLLCVVADACTLSDGSTVTPFFVDESSTVSPATGSSCAPFLSLSAALMASASQSLVTLSLQSSASLPTWEVRNTLAILGNSHSISLLGKIEVYEELSISALAITSVFETNNVFEVLEGSLTLIDCFLSGFVSNIISVRGQITVEASVFSNNSMGIFDCVELGVMISISDSKFNDNAGSSGAIFEIYPKQGEAATTVTVTNCDFQRNGAIGGLSVLALNDMSVDLLGESSLALQTISFSGCRFKEQVAAVFQVASKVFGVSIDSSWFENEPQIVTGSLGNTSLSLSRSSVTNCAGPLLSLTLSGQLFVTATNFTNISSGPVIYVTGSQPAVSLVYVSHVSVNFITNLSTVLYGTLLNAVSATVWMTDVHLNHFTTVSNGIFSLYQATLYTQGLTCYNGTAQAGVIGQMTACTVVMNNTLMDEVNSRGSMSAIVSSSFFANHIIFRNITGFWDVNLAVYTTNYFLFVGSTAAIDDLAGELVVPGSTLIYVSGAKCTLSNAHFRGPLGMGLFTVLGGSITVRSSDFSFTKGRSIAKLLLGGFIDFDLLCLRDLTLSSPLITISSHSAIYMHSLVLVNVTTVALSKGQDYTLRVDSAYITRSAVAWLSQFGIGVSLDFGNLVMKDTIGQMLSVFGSNISISSAEIVNVRTSQMLMYLSDSQVRISSAVISNLTFNYAGDLATILDHSMLGLYRVMLSDISGLEHGVINLQQSSLNFTDCTVSHFNVSLIVGYEAEIEIMSSYLIDIRVIFDAKTLSMLPSGGVISCTDCPALSISSSYFRNISANEGGVIFSQATTVPFKVVVSASRFEHCEGKTNGGVLKTLNQAVTIRDCIFEHNNARMGGVIDFHSTTQLLTVTNSSFVGNIATLDGSCIRWTGLPPLLSTNSYVNNTALYGNPLASTPDHFILLQPSEQFPVLGVTGQRMDQPLLVGVFDVIEQLIVTDNSTLVGITTPEGLVGSGNKELLAMQGLVSFSLLFSPYSTSTTNLTFYSAASSVSNLTIQYGFRPCQPGEIIAASGCLPCPKNSYSFHPTDVSCKLCPEHAQCFGLIEVYLDKNYWRPNNLTDDIYSCLIPGVCSGGLNSECREGYTATLCGACVKGYYRHSNWRCKKCEEEIHPAARGIIISTLVISAVTIPPQLFLRKEGRLYTLALLFRVLFNYAHVFLFAILLHVQWPTSTLLHHEIWSTIGSYGQDLIYSSCQYDELDGFFFHVIAAVLCPALLVFVATVLWVLANIKFKYSFTKLCKMVLSVSFVAVYNTIPLLSLAITSMLQCTTVAGSNWLVMDTSHECWTGTHLAHIYKVIIPSIIFLTGVYIVAVWCIKHHSSTGVLQYVCQYMAAGYKHKYATWELRMMQEKILLVWLSLAYPLLDKFSQIILFMCVVGCATHIEVKRQPYSYK